ncbi:DNA ligase (ATP) [Lunasporangiospora selenospora]|uniref:DNA ligase n=1 Tax=Lunasporangiospora selenospora TaxID=979761 RepID=A0A9P6FYY4_9FUNG|nr:DNA ligase (ATP) [Lunasporangiospora selenospora]
MSGPSGRRLFRPPGPQVSTTSMGAGVGTTKTDPYASVSDDDPTVPSPRFHDLVMLLEDISRRRTEKSQLLRAYFKASLFNKETAVARECPRHKSNNQNVAGTLDRNRGRYGLKEQKMADIYITTLNIVQGSEAANKLKYWKEGIRDSAGDFSLVASEVIASRSLVTHSQGQTIRDVNQLLTGLSTKGSDNIKIFRTLVQSYTALENKWIIRIINKDLKIGMSENSVLPCYHPDAADLFNVCSDLQKTVIDCADPNVRISTSTISISQPFKPMLAKKLHSAKEVLECMGGHHPFWIENKLDGERVQVHKNGENYRYWSRNSTEFTHLYGANPREGSLTPFIHPLINAKAESLILDGEMLEWDPATKQIISFGTVKTAGGDHSENEHKRRPCSSIIDHPLELRHEMLPSLIPKEVEGRLEILKHDVGTTEAHIVEAIDTAVMDRQEGIIIKNPRSRYIPNGRGQEWVKLKPEYVDGVFDSLDVLVVGGFYGTGSRGGQGVISSYLCAVCDNTSKFPNGKKLLSFCKFGTGFTFEQMGDKRLGPHWKEYKHYRENPWVEIVDNAKMRPDVIIDPEKSIVVEIKAAEIIANSTSYAAEYTLRFPRFMRIRDDKDASSCLTMSEVHRMYREFRGKLSTKQVDTTRSSALTKTKKKTGTKRSTQAHLLHTIVGTDTSKVRTIEDVFNGQVFYVVRGDSEQSKADLEVMIKEFGGVQSQSYLKENTIVVAGLQERRLLPFNPKYMLFATKKTENQFRMIMDEFEDSYTEPLTMEAFQDILDKMPNRSEVVRHKRVKIAQAKTEKIRVKRLNNLEDQVEAGPSRGAFDTHGGEIGVDESKDLLLQDELGHDTEETWRREDATRAQKITATLTRHYFGLDGEMEGPQGMFQGLQVFIVRPPSDEEYLKASGVAQDNYSRATTAGIFDTLSRAVDNQNGQRDREVINTMPHIRTLSPPLSDQVPCWKYLEDEANQANAIENTLSTLSNYRICRNNLEMVQQILEFYGAHIIPKDQCTIEHCQRLLRRRAARTLSDSSLSIEGETSRSGVKKESNEVRSIKQEANDHSASLEDDSDGHDQDVGVPLRICILFDPMYLDQVESWKVAIQMTTLYGENAGVLSLPRPRLITTAWVQRSYECGYCVPEEGYYPVE